MPRGPNAFGCPHKQRTFPKCTSPKFLLVLSDTLLSLVMALCSVGVSHSREVEWLSPIRMTDLDKFKVKSVAAGRDHTALLCIDAEDAPCVLTFGYNDFGELGHGNTIDLKIPKRVEALAGSRPVAVTATEQCTIVALATGEVLTTQRR